MSKRKNKKRSKAKTKYATTLSSSKCSNSQTAPTTLNTSSTQTTLSLNQSQNSKESSSKFILISKILGWLWALILSVTCVGWVTWGEEWSEIIRSSEIVENCFLKGYAIKLWKGKLNKIRLNESREYIVDVVGIPQKSEIIDDVKFEYLKDSEDINDEYKKDIYVNHYFTMICVYKNAILEGFLVISNKEDFDYTSYRSGIVLSQDSISSSAQRCENINTYYTLIAANCGPRWDNNTYYVECRTQHSAKATPSVIIGYGICDISESFEGDVSIPSELYSFCLSVNNPNNDDSHTVFNSEEEHNLLFENEEVKNFRNSQRVNAVIVFNDDIDLLKNTLIDSIYLGVCKDEYYNLCDNYIDYLYYN